MQIEMHHIGSKYLGVIIEDSGARIDLGTLDNNEMIDLAQQFAEAAAEVLCYVKGAEE